MKIRVHCSNRGISVESARMDIGDTCDTYACTLTDFLRIAEHWWNTYCEKSPRQETDCCGNAAAMREFAEYVANYPTCQGCNGHTDSRFCDICEKGVALAPLALRAKLALAKPPRNCDRLTKGDAARQAWLDDEDNWDDFGNPKLELHQWLFAKAKKEGGEKC